VPQAQPLPPVLLFDLDDTIVSFDRHSAPAWRHVCETAAARCGRDAAVLYGEIQRVSDAYWDDPERHRLGRLDLDNTRRRLVREAFAGLGIDAGPADEVTNAFIALREGLIEMFPGAKEALVELARTHRLALITNGESNKQRAKIDRFALAPLFERIFIEEEIGFGKPDPRVFHHGLAAMQTRPADCCMIGDNLSWDIAAPQSLGIFTIWNDWRGNGLPLGTTVEPDRIIRSISELLDSREDRPKACAGNTYRNDCERQAAGVSEVSEGARILVDGGAGG
jgi:putative hydrolase of the HAD superfamily